ncbi:MAG: ribose-phosphate pyrophosphokinase, partial [Patescibacteria group bacterium]|nr:ribose-phosphate pyrophosphokinase [Patescibacteria group bacterium]
MSARQNAETGPSRAVPRSTEVHSQPSVQPETLLVTDSLVLLRGRSNPTLGESVRRNLQTRIGEPITIWDATEAFPDSEITAHIETSVRDKEVYIVQPTSPVFGPNGEKQLSVSESITELKLMARAARAGGAKRIVAILGYYGNSRSDKETQQRQPIHAAITAEELESCGINMILTLDLHSPQIKGFWRTGEWIDFPTAAVMAPFLKQELNGNVENYAVVAPD